MAPAKTGAFKLSIDSPGTVSITGALNFATAAKALEEMRDAFTLRDCHTLDLVGVDSCDSAGLACVLAVLAEANQRGRRVTVCHVPAGMEALAQVCGVEPFLH